MNHLAHFFLSRHSEKMMVGNFIADSVKGKKFRDYEKEISRGILMHREIDSFTDTHEIVKHSKSFFRTRYGLYSSVIIDLVYDHFLGANWNSFSDSPLPSFAEQCYKVFEKYLLVMPERNQRMLPFMQKQNWLVNYAEIEGITRSLKGLSGRIKNDPGIGEAHEELSLHYKALSKDFQVYFPLLIHHISSYT
ncbi:MAG: ACP phosphodiesterase [Chitinophagales bacterium]